MKAVYEKKFLKELAKMPKKVRQIVELFVFQEIEKLSKLDDISNLKKLKGHDSAYRIRFGNYRLGFFYNNGQMYLDRIAHRSEFYRSFPD